MRYQIFLALTFTCFSVSILSGCVGRGYSLAESLDQPRVSPEIVSSEQEDMDRSLDDLTEIADSEVAPIRISLKDEPNRFAAEKLTVFKADFPELLDEIHQEKPSKISLSAFVENEQTEIAKVESFAIPLPDSESSELPSVNDSFGSGGQGMTLEDFEQLALVNNPTIKQLSASASQARGLQNQVGLSANPTVGYIAGQLADQGTDQHVLFIEQEFVRGNKLALNRRVLSRAKQAQMWEAETQKYRVLTDIRINYYEAAASQRIKELAKDFVQVTKKGAEIAKLRREALEGTQIDVLQAQVQLTEIEIRRQQAEYSFQGAWKKLSAIAGMPYLAPAPLMEEMKPSTDIQDWESTYQTMLVSSPELSAAQARVCEARANLDRQNAQPVSNVTVQLGAGVDNGTGSGMLNLQFSAPLPMNNKNEGNISAAYAKYCQATHEVKRIELAIKSRLAQVSQEYDSSKVAVLKYEKVILPKAQQTLNLSEEAYKAGELNFLHVLIVQRTYFESNLRYINAVRDLAQAHAKIDGLLLTGGLDKPSEYNGDDSLRGQTFSGQ